uniref:Catenin delta-2-like n=1 Tax=Phallusia mammillata TaxID=59560 RepID=A0A6F9D9J2_9ASCI|nr:catenin delta-2-like [Phallusia mammillata]
MSFGKTSNHSFTGQADTEYILASVKEQEIQFERLTRELEEEHLTVAGQLQQYRVEPPAHSTPSTRNGDEELKEGSDTESKRDLAPEQEHAEHQPYTNASVPHSYPTSDGQVKLHHHRSTPNNLAKSQTLIAPYSQHSQASYAEPQPQKPVLAHPRPYYASPPRSLVLDQPPFPTHFSPPPVYQSSGFNYPEFQYQDIHPTAYYVNIPTAYVAPQSAGQIYQEIPAGNMNRTQPHRHSSNSYQVIHSQPHSYQQQAHSQPNYQPPQYARPPPPKPKPPAPPRRHSQLQKPTEFHPPPVVHHKQQPQNHIPSKHYSAPHLHDYTHKNLHSPASRDRRISTESHPGRSKSFHGTRKSDPVPGNRVFTPVDMSHEPVEYRHKSHRLSASPRAVAPTHQHGILYNDPANPDSFTFERDPSINEVIQMLRHHNYQVVSNAAAYIQHVTFADDHMKAVIRKKGVIPLLVNLLHHHVIDVQRNACGALRNMVYGRNNDEAKLVVRSCGGISSLAHVLRNTEDQEMKELITGVLWNLSSCEQLKNTISDSAMSALASRIIIHYVTLIDPYRMAKYCPEEMPDSYTDLTASDFTIDPNWSSLFINATGCLRNISSAGVEVRRKMRECDGLIEALLLVVENVIGKSDVDSKGVENCMCILRNLSYRLAVEVEAAHVPLSRDVEASKLDGEKDEECWRRHKKKEKRKSKDVEVIFNTSRTSSQISVQGVEMLWQPDVVRRYLALLAETCNFGTLEAASGAMQNLSAGQWVWSANIRTAVRKEKGLPMLVEFLHMDNERIVTVICSALRNMALDIRNKQLIGKHAMQDFVDLLPNADELSSPSGNTAFDFPQIGSQRVLLIDAVCGALRELVNSSTENAVRLHAVGAVPKLVAISRSTGYRYPHRLIKAAGRVLATLWDYKSLRSSLKKEGWTHYHFALAGVPSVASVGSQVSPYASPPMSPDDSNGYREIPESPAYSNAQMQVPPPKHQQIYTRPSLPYAPMSPYPNHPKNFHSPQPDSNYVTMIQGDALGAIDSWV